MYAAVNKWEQLSLERPGKPGIAPLAAGLTRMRFHQFAGKPVLARQEGVRLLAQDKGNLDLLLQLTELYLIDPVPQPAEAQKYLDAAFETVPKDSVPLLRLKAVVKERMGDPAGAAAVYEQMTVLFPTDSTGYGNLVRLATAQGKPEDATRWAVKWSEKQPENDLAVLELIRQYSVTGAKPAAKSEAESLVKKVAERAKKAAEKAPADPKNPVEKQVTAARTAAHRLIASAFKQAKAFDEADAHIQAALAATPGDLATRMIAGEVAIAKEDWDAAVKVYKGIVAEDATNGVAGNNLAWVLATKKDQPAEALALVEKARTREGASKPIGAERLSPAFLDTIGVVYAKQSNKEKLTEMRDIFETAVRRFPSDPRMHFWLAEAYTALGENAKATARYEVAATLCEKTVVGLPDEERTKLRDQIAAKTKKRN